MRLGITEQRHHSVAQILGDMAAEAGYLLGRRAMVSGHRFAPFLGVEPRRDLGRTDQIAEQHRQMPPLTVTWAGRISIGIIGA